MRSLSRAALLLALVAALPLLLAAAAAPGAAAPDFALRDLAGRELKLSSLRGQIVVLDFWASWCEPCKKSLPALAGVAKRWQGRGVAFVTVSLDQERKNAERTARDAGLGKVPVLLDPGGERVAARYDLPAMPTTYVIDREGVIRFVHAGYRTHDEQRLEQELLGLTK